MRSHCLLRMRRVAEVNGKKTFLENWERPAYRAEPTSLLIHREFPASSALGGNPSTPVPGPHLSEQTWEVRKSCPQAGKGHTTKTGQVPYSGSPLRRTMRRAPPAHHQACGKLRASLPSEQDTGRPAGRSRALPAPESQLSRGPDCQLCHSHSCISTATRFWLTASSGLMFTTLS